MPTDGLSTLMCIIVLGCLGLVSALEHVGPYVTFESVVVINSRPTCTNIIDGWSLLESIQFFISRIKNTSLAALFRKLFK